VGAIGDQERHHNYSNKINILPKTETGPMTMTGLEHSGLIHTLSGGKSYPKLEPVLVTQKMASQISSALF
jgi:hypothetical protein